MISIIVQQEDDVITCEFNELCNALKYVETTIEVCNGARVTIQEKE